jgi:beta-glucosidase
LSSTTFKLDKLVLNDPVMRWDATLEASVRITNAGKRRGSETLQLYTRDRVASRTRPIRELKRIERVTLEPGESRTLRFTLTRADLEFVGDGNKRIAEPGQFDMWVGQSSTDGLHAQFTLYAAG